MQYIRPIKTCSGDQDWRFKNVKILFLGVNSGVSRIVLLVGDGLLYVKRLRLSGRFGEITDRSLRQSVI